MKTFLIETMLVSLCLFEILYHSRTRVSSWYYFGKTIVEKSIQKHGVKLSVNVNAKE